MNMLKFIPGIASFSSHEKGWFIKDLLAGLSVTAIALPVGIACAGIIGLPPEVGLYSSILPVTAFALFGSSKKLIVGPDSAISMMVAASILPFAGRGAPAYYEACLLLTLLAGVICILGGLLRLGFIADFLSKPILVGYLNGVAFSIIAGQSGKVFGYQTVHGGFFKVAGDFLSKLSETHLPTLIIGVSVIVFLVVCGKAAPQLPAALIAIAGTMAAVYFLNLTDSGVNVIGNIHGGALPIGIPSVNTGDVIQLLPAALSIVLISYCSGMLTNKNISIKHNLELDANRAFIGFGAADIASALSGGFAVTGSDSRSIVALFKAKTNFAAVFASLMMLLILLFLTAPLRYLPAAATSAVIIVAVSTMFNISYLKKLYTISKNEFLLSIVTALAVMTIGVMEGVLISIGLAIIMLLKRAARPEDEILGRIPNTKAYASIQEYDTAETIPGLLIYKFNSAIIFFNADYLRARIKHYIDDSETKIECLLIEADSVNFLDSTGNDILGDIITELKAKKIKVIFARTKNQVFTMLKKSQVAETIGEDSFYPSVHAGVEAYLNKKVLE